MIEHDREGRRWAYLLESSHQKNAGSTIAATNHVVGSLINPDMQQPSNATVPHSSHINRDKPTRFLVALAALDRRFFIDGLGYAL